MEEILNESATSGLAAAAKCAHAGCICTVEDGERYCSDYCHAQEGGEQAQAHDEDDDECQCGHAECEHARAPVAVGLLTGLPTG